MSAASPRESAKIYAFVPRARPVLTGQGPHGSHPTIIRPISSRSASSGAAGIMMPRSRKPIAPVGLKAELQRSIRGAIEGRNNGSRLTHSLCALASDVAAARVEHGVALREIACAIQEIAPNAGCVIRHHRTASQRRRTDRHRRCPGRTSDPTIVSSHSERLGRAVLECLADVEAPQAMPNMGLSHSGSGVMSRGAGKNNGQAKPVPATARIYRTAVHVFVNLNPETSVAAAS